MKIIDLTMLITNNMEVYPGDPEVKVEVFSTIKENGWELRKLSMGSHTATHVDAFSHMDNYGKNLEQISLDRFFGEAQLVSIEDDFPLNIGLLFDEEVSIEMLEKILVAKPNFVGGNITLALERELLKNEVVTYTNLVNLKQLPLHETFMFYGFPLRINEGDGSPVRAVAIVNKK